MKAKQLHRIFDPRRILADDPTKLKGSCSEFLGLFALLRHWVDVEAPVDEAIRPHKMSFVKLCEVLDLILHIKRGVISPADGAPRLDAAVAEYMRLHQVLGPPIT